MIIKNDLDLEDEETEATEPTEEEEETITNYVYYINGSMEWVKDITVNNINKVKDWLDNDYLTYGRIRNHTFESLARLVPIHPNSLNTVVRVLAFRKKPIISFKSKLITIVFNNPLDMRGGGKKWTKLIKLKREYAKVVLYPIWKERTLKEEI